MNNTTGNLTQEEKQEMNELLDNYESVFDAIHDERLCYLFDKKAGLV